MRPDIYPAIQQHPRVLERPNRTLTALAQEVASLVRPLLFTPQMFVGIESDVSGELCLTWWGPDFRQIARISAVPLGFCPPDSAEGKLQEAAASLLSYLAGRWPVPPRRLGAITDGTGVAFAPDRPSHSEAGWLLRQATTTGELVAIIPLDPAGPCALLDTARGAIH